MAEVKYGQVDWEEGSASAGSDFMNFEQGDNNIRIFTKPYQFIVHWVKDNTGVNRKIKCAIENCPLCRKGIKAQFRWFLGVLDRDHENQPKLVEISSQVYIAIKNLHSNKKWGDVKMYDITVKRNAPKSNPLYAVSPDPDKGPITAEEKVVVRSFLERVDINKFIQPSTPAEVAEKLGASFVNDTPVQYAVGNKTVTNDGVKPVISESDFNFGDDL